MSHPTFFEQLEFACPPASVRLVELRTGHPFFRQGDDPPGLPFVQEGQVDLVRWTEAGRAIRIHVARAGETFAEASIYVNECHCDAVASAPTTLRLLPKRFVLRAFETSPELAQAFTVHLAHSLMTARRLLELRATTPLTQRLMIRLGELANADGALPTSTRLASIAADLDVTAPALYRTIAALERQGKLTRPRRGQVQLRNAHAPQ